MIAVLVRFFGVKHFDLIEDMVQSALVEALHAWKLKGVPDNPGGWIHRVAKNRILDSLRRDVNLKKKIGELGEFVALNTARQSHRINELFDDSEIQDSVLRMIFVCCHPVLKHESQIALTLKLICGFSEQEISRALLTREETIRKRIYRAKLVLVENKISVDLPPLTELTDRIDAVHNVLYLMFNEGYSSSGGDEAIRMDVCEEAARLCHLLTEHAACSNSATHALLALMLFHGSRFESRVGSAGELVLLQHQDRSQWDYRLIRKAMDYMEIASNVSEPSVYHLEAAIAFQHCHAESFEATNWTAIIKLYDALWSIRQSPVYRLNQAIAIGQRDGPDAAIAQLDMVRDDGRLNNFHLLSAAYGLFSRMKGDFSNAQIHFEKAKTQTQASHDIELLERQIEACTMGERS
jgi:RNA polymerase sigma-70 factor (ECF subfamily)